MKDTQITLTTSDGIVTADTPEALLQGTLGWSIPVSDLEYWIRGHTSPHAPVDASEVNGNQLLSSLNQQGWTIRYSSYHTFTDFSLPRKIIASRDGLKLTLVIKRWQF